jgi:regulatory protein
LREQPSPVRTVALRLLLRRPRSARDLAGALARRGFPGEEIEAALEYLTDCGYLDDVAFARAYVEGRRDRLWGRRRFEGELSARGVDRRIIQEVLGPFDPAAERERACQAARRLSAEGRGARRVAAALERRGFAGAAIRAALDQLGE